MTSTAASPESQKKQRKPPLSSFPTVKIFTPPSGLHSRKIDEWCLTLCTQSTFNRHQGRLPECHSVCLRRVFPLEVRRLMALHQSRNPGAGAGALPPLPPEGQPERVPWQLGGKRGKVESDAMDGDYDEDDPPTGIPGRVLEPPRTWKEGWYLWSMGSLSAFWNHTHQMATTLENVDQNGKVKRPPRRQPARLVEIDHEFDNHTEENLLIPIPPDTPPIIEPVKKFLKPSGLVLNLFYDSVVEGHQREFFGRVWEKAQTDEPWKLAYNSVKRFYERWKQNARSGDDDEEEKRR